MAQSIIHEDLNAAGQVTCFNANKSLFMAEWKHALVHCFTILYHRSVNVNDSTAIKWVQNIFYLFSDPRYFRAVQLFESFSLFSSFVFVIFIFQLITNCTVIYKYLSTSYNLRNSWWKVWVALKAERDGWAQPLWRDDHFQIRSLKLSSRVAAITFWSHDGHICQYTAVTQLDIQLTVLLPRRCGDPRGWEREVSE